MHLYDLPMPTTPLIGREHELSESAQRRIHDWVTALTARACMAALAEGREVRLDEAIGRALATVTFAHDASESGRPDAPATGAAPLTARERQVATLVARGCTNRQIAQELVIAERTAESHVANICAKLDCTSRSQVAAWAARRGLL